MTQQEFIETVILATKEDRQLFAKELHKGEWCMAWDHGQTECHQGRFQEFSNNQFMVDGVDYDYVTLVISHAS